MGKHRVVGCVAAMALLVAAVGCSSSRGAGGATSVMDRVAVVGVVSSLKAGSPVGFAPEMLAEVTNPESILPVGALVVPVAASLDEQGDKASVDAVVSVAGQPDARYWVLLERRDGSWVVYMTIPLDL